MRRGLAATALLLSLAAGARAQASPTALVWIPAEDFRQWSRLDAVLRARSDLKLTVALTPAMATPLLKAALGSWADSGRLEFAARIPGDPILPLTAAHPAAPRPDDALERAAAARSSLEKRLSCGPVGLVPGAGALEASLIGPLAASGAPWVLAGPYEAPGGAWAAEGRTSFVPGRAAGAPFQEGLENGGALVVDESASAETALLSWLSDERPRAPQGWATVSELERARTDARVPASETPSWPAWGGAPASAPASAGAQAAWRAYGEAAKALERYQNSGAADMKVLETATTLLRKAQDARFYRAVEGDDAEDLPADLRSRLLAVYKKVKAPAPESLYETTVSTAAAELPTSVRAASGPNWVSYDNPAASLARAPAGALDAAPWRLRGLRVEWDKDAVVFRLFLGHADADAAPPKPLFDLYIDLNRVVGAGSVRLLDGRGAYAAARDAWEFALTAVGPQAGLWRATPRGELEELASLKAETDAARGELRVSVPRTVLRGNPARWGYILLALAESPERAGQKPPATLVLPDGSIILGALAPLDAQKAIADKPGAPQRVSAVRLEP